MLNRTIEYENNVYRDACSGHTDKGRNVCKERAINLLKQSDISGQEYYGV